MSRSKRTTEMLQVRCAIYTRKSTDEGLEQEFNTLHAQRDSGEAFIKSQQAEGWVCVPDRYDDGGFTGGNMERPALQRLMDDIKAGKVDCVVVYKVDRLSRSLLDFARMMSVFEEHGVSFVSVTQQFNTASSMGRLMLNVLLSFAQFEREVISERTRDKIAATRRKGKWAGGHPVLGYDIDPNGFKLVVNEDEAEQVRQIYKLYLTHRSLLPVVTELNERGWNTKRWITRKGLERGGKPFTKNSVWKLLTNIVYRGKVKYKDEVHEGEHVAIVDDDVWEKVQRMLTTNGRTGGSAARNKYGALLKGLIQCVPCGCTMGHTYSMKNGSVKYRYYVCLKAQKQGWHRCPSKSVPAQEIEQLVVDQIRCIGRDQSLLAATLEQAQKETHTQLAELEKEERRLTRELKRSHEELQEFAADASAGNGSTSARLSDLNDRIRQCEERIIEVRKQRESLSRRVVDQQSVGRALDDFEALWESLTPREQVRVVQLLVERIDYDGVNGKVAITFRPAGFRALATELVEEAAA